MYSLRPYESPPCPKGWRDLGPLYSVWRVNQNIVQVAWFGRNKVKGQPASWYIKKRVMFSYYLFEHKENEMGQYLKAALKYHESNGDTQEAHDKYVESNFPAIMDFLATSLLPDGKKRKTSTLTLFAREGMWKLALKDSGLKKTFWGEGSTVLDAATELEHELLDFAAPKRKKTADKAAKPRQTSAMSGEVL